MKNRQSVGAEPYAPKQMKAITGGGKGRTIPVTTACMSRSWKVEVCRKKKVTRRDDQSAISSKEHVKHEATKTYLSVTYQHDRQTTTAMESGTTATRKHAIHTHLFIQRVFSGKKKQQTMRYGDERMPPLVSSVDTVYLLPPFEWRSLTIQEELV